MTELRDLSKLPVDRAYWAGLEAKVTARLESRVRALPATRTRWWVPTARGAWLSGGMAVAATMAALVLVPPRPPVEPATPTGLLHAPDDAVTLEFVTATAPPSLGWLVIASNGSTR